MHLIHITYFTVFCTNGFFYSVYGDEGVSNWFSIASNSAWLNRCTPTAPTSSSWVLLSETIVIFNFSNSEHISEVSKGDVRWRLDRFCATKMGCSVWLREYRIQQISWRLSFDLDCLLLLISRTWGCTAS